MVGLSVCIALYCIEIAGETVQTPNSPVGRRSLSKTLIFTNIRRRLALAMAALALEAVDCATVNLHDDLTHLEVYQPPHRHAHRT